MLVKLSLSPELQLNKANILDNESPFLDLHFTVANEFVSSKIYDKRDHFDFDIHVVTFPFLDVGVPRRASYGVYILQLIWFAKVCNHVTDFNARNKFNGQTSPRPKKIRMFPVTCQKKMGR